MPDGRQDAASSPTARAPLVAAIAFAVLLLAGSSVVPMPPGVTDTGGALVTYYREHHDAIALQAWLTMASTVPGVVLFAFVADRLASVSRVVFVIPAATTVALVAAGLLVRLGLARHPATLDAGTARALADVEAYWAPLLTFAIVTQSLAIIAAVKNASFPRWLGWISLVLAAEQLLETATVFGDHGFLAPGGDMNWLLGPGLYAIWILGLGVACSTFPPPRAPDR
ncbi:hypothetical protein NBH00_02890 [Paraconexibacter antarcticus]|uniref:DUF4386 domain-containing protein n=1 Tax=Paraconexibacter antarcticus TaxID=2949664 RepID=A0ABY5DT16_9ACTN|nr:hypothetical protein [Paraconexibacter antarcticus]UTI65165.1 hypothetical protein NBH00_02890 [Paraconexibacter antarcticus]